MKKFVFLFAFSLVLLSCNKKEEHSGSLEARELFNLSAETILDYIKSIPEAKDSADVDSLYNRFQKEVTDINFKFPPETDLKLTEQENDSLFVLLQRLNIVRKEKLESLVFNPNDSISEEKGGVSK